MEGNRRLGWFGRDLRSRSGGAGYCLVKEIWWHANRPIMLHHRAVRAMLAATLHDARMSRCSNGFSAASCVGLANLLPGISLTKGRRSDH